MEKDESILIYTNYGFNKCFVETMGLFWCMFVKHNNLLEFRKDSINSVDSACEHVLSSFLSGSVQKSII